MGFDPVKTVSGAAVASSPRNSARPPKDDVPATATVPRNSAGPPKVDTPATVSAPRKSAAPAKEDDQVTAATPLTSSRSHTDTRRAVPSLDLLPTIMSVL